jgi:hypothetical protein
MDSKTAKSLITIIILVIAISYSLDKLVFFGFNGISDKVKTGQGIGKLNQFLVIKDSLEVVVFGNSRANHHINVDLFCNNGYNMGMDGSGIAYTSTLINTLSKDTKQIILVHIDTKNFFDVNYDGNDIRSLKTKYQRNKVITDALNKSGQLSTLHRAFLSMNYNGNAIGIIKNYFKPNYNYKTYNGFDPLLVSEAQASMRDIILTKTNPTNCFESYEFNNIAIDYLKSIKSFVQSSPNKTFIFITSPIYDDKCNEDNLKLASLMTDLGLTYWDFTNLFKDSKNKSYWKDFTHMSKQGAEVFSEHLLFIYNNFKY